MEGNWVCGLERLSDSCVDFIYLGDVFGVVTEHVVDVNDEKGD